MANYIQNKTNGNAVSNTTQKTTMHAYIKSMEGEIKKALPSVMTPERFTRMVLSALSTTPKLAECTPKSFLGAMMQAAQLGVEPNTMLGQAYLIPRKNHGTLECQFQLGYKGLLDLAYRSEQVELVQAQIVYENDLFDCQYGLEPKLKHVPADGDRGKAIKCYALFKTKSGGYGFEVDSIDAIMKFAKANSDAFGSEFSPWSKHPDEMIKKTMIKRVLKYAPLKSEFARAVATDETIKNNLDADMYTVRDETEYNEVIDEEGEIHEETNAGTENT